MQRTSGFLLLFLVAASFFVGCIFFGIFFEPSVSSFQSPHIVVIIADDLGWNDVSFHGANQIPTPNLDALAYNGVILQKHYVLPICTPSRTAFLTGQYPIRTGMQGYPLKAAEPRGIPLKNTLLPEYLKTLGYATHLLGKWHVGYYTKHHTPTHRGFDSFFGYYNGYIQYFNHTLTENNIKGYDLHRDTPNMLSANYNYEYITDLLTEKAEEVIAKHNPKKPLFLQVAHVAAHSSDAKNSIEVRNMSMVDEKFGYIEDINRRRLAGMISSMDDSVGRVVEALDKADMLENSIILFMSDNGAQTEGFLENFGSNYPLRGLKFTLFEGGVRGAACLYSPLIKKTSRISNELLHITDWLPTLYSAAGGNPSDLKDLDGTDQWKVLTTGVKGKRKAILLNIDELEGTSAALIDRYKLVIGAKRLYGGYYGDTGMNDPSWYKASDISKSLAGMTIARMTNTKLHPGKINQLREEATLHCNSTLNYPECFDQCLFDIYNDPCETTDISTSHPKIVVELRDFIESYRKVLMPQQNKSPDPAGYPDHFNGTWMPWLQEEILTIA